MRVMVALLVASAGLMLTGWVPPWKAAADPSDDPCPLAVALVCRFLPVAPNLDGDIDLTKQLPPADPFARAPDHLPPADVCAPDCI
jgi:hypothetical protein